MFDSASQRAAANDGELDRHYEREFHLTKVFPRPGNEKMSGSKKASPHGIFLCYRREDSADVTGRIYDRLVDHFGHENVFMDVDSVTPGLDFRSEIDQKIKDSKIAIVVIGDQWLAPVDGKRRIDDENDRVRIEIEAALELKIPIIPVLTRGASHPTKAMLPASLEHLAYRHGTSIRHEHFRGDMDSLINHMDSISAIAASKEPAVWRRKRVIIVTAVAATVIVLLAITGLLTRPHLSVGRSAANDYAEAVKLATGLGGTRIDLPKAAEYLQRAAAKNVPEAEASLAYWVNNGRGGLAKDNVKGEQWAKKALADGLTAKAKNSVEAQTVLGRLYESGLGVPKDLGKAAELYQKAADQGLASAQVNLGAFYYLGEGVPMDLEKAKELYQKAADQGLAVGERNLGTLYKHGEGVPMDLEKARELYQKAADQGD